MEASVSYKLILYADDSALLVSGKHIKNIENVLGDNLLSLSNWLIDNKLSLHLGKTESILFGTKHMLSKHSKLAISCGNNVITSKTVIRYLGVDLEQTLSGTAIVENILKKGNSRLKFLYRQAKYLNTRSRKLLTSALILCHFDYACSAWHSGLQKTMKHKLQILLNKTIRFALDLPPTPLLIYPPPPPPHTSRHHTFNKDAVASSGCHSGTIKSQHHAQDCPWRSSMLSY